MLFSSLPWWGNALFLAALLFFKYWLIGRIEKTSYYTSRLEGKGWMSALNIISGLNGLVTIGILLLPAGKVIAILAGIVDAIAHWLIGYWKIKKAIPKIDDGNIQDALAFLQKAWKWIASFHAATYLSIGTWIADQAGKHPEWVKALTTWITGLLHISS